VQALAADETPWDMRDEKWYVKKVQEIIGGDTWVRTGAGTLVDLLFDAYACEVDRANKWYEAIGQAAHYAVEMDRPPLCILVARTPKDEKYIERAIVTAGLTFVNIKGRNYHVGLIILRDYEVK